MERKPARTKADLLAARPCRYAAAPNDLTDAAGANEDKAALLCHWYEAFAFCAWDGGRLPTETE